MAGTVTVDQAKLVLNSFAAIFQNNLTSSELVSWRKFDSEMNDRNALTVVEQVTPHYVVTHTNSAVQDLTTPGTQNTVFGSEQYKVQDIFGSSMGWQDFVKIRDIGAARESEALKGAALSLAEQIDAYILGFAVNASNNYLGTPGNTVSLYDDVASGYTRLKEEGVDDTDLRAVLTYGDKQALGSAVVTDNASLAKLGDGVYRNGWDGSIAGVPTLFTQQLPTLATGTHGVSTVTGGSQNVDYQSVAISGAPGQFMTQTLIASIGSGVETALDGEVFTIAGVFGWDNRLQAQKSNLQQFRVVGSSTAVAGAVTLRIFPAIIVPSAFSNTQTINNDTAHATVSAAPAGGAVITWVTPASSNIKPRAILNKNAIVVSTADLIMPATGIGSRKSLTKVPLSVRMWQNSVFNTGEHQVRFDVALSANVRDRRRIVRINGA
jgi:P22 coat protein - gene protein 5